MLIKEVIKIFIKITALFFLVLALWLVYKEVHAIGLNRLWNLVIQTPLWILSIACGFIILDFIALSGYDFLALKYIGKKLPTSAVIKTADISFSITNTTGHSYLAGGSVRYLLYQPYGLSEFDILKIIAFESVTFLLGMGLVFDISLIISSLLHLPRIGENIFYFYIGAGLVAILYLSYWLFIILPRRTLHFEQVTLSAPSPKMTLKQMIVSAIDLSSAALVFYTLLSSHLDVNLFHVVSIFLLAQIIGISTQIPGGLGVFEGSFLYLFTHTSAEKGAILAALISFRILYYFVPLFIGTGFLIATEIYRHQKKKNT